MEWFMELNPIAQGLSDTIFTWAITALGAALVFFFKTVDRRILNCMLGFGAGVMIAASFWSLLNPAIELCDNLGYSEIILPSIGFFSGGIFGVAFGGVAAGIPSATIGAAISLALGIGLQNFPEGAAVSLPLRREGLSRTKSFFYGQASGIVEPIAGFLGAMAAVGVRSMLPFFLAFSAGAMVSVVGSELLPEASIENKALTTIGLIFGFITMMILDVTLG